METAFIPEFSSQCILRMEENVARIDKCFQGLSEAEVWHRPNCQLVSIANLVLHLCGNITQYAISSLGGAPDKRARDLEFSATGGYTKEELMDKLHKTVDLAIKTIRQTTSEEWLKVRTVQGFSMSGIGIVVHITEHLSYHTGQIALHTKLLQEKDLGFYAGIDLSVKNEEDLG